MGGGHFRALVSAVEESQQAGFPMRPDVANLKKKMRIKFREFSGGAVKSVLGEKNVFRAAGWNNYPCGLSGGQKIKPLKLGNKKRKRKKHFIQSHTRRTRTLPDSEKKRKRN